MSKKNKVYEFIVDYEFTDRMATKDNFKKEMEAFAEAIYTDDREKPKIKFNANDSVTVRFNGFTTAKNVRQMDKLLKKSQTEEFLKVSKMISLPTIQKIAHPENSS